MSDTSRRTFLAGATLTGAAALSPANAQTGRDMHNGMSAEDVRRLARIRSLHEDLGLDIYAVEVVLRMRRQVVQLLDQMEEIEQRSARREEYLLGEIRTLHRRLAQESDWR